MDEIKLPVVGRMDRYMFEVLLGLVFLFWAMMITGTCNPCSGFDIVNPVCQAGYASCLWGESMIKGVMYLGGITFFIHGIYKFTWGR